MRVTMRTIMASGALAVLAACSDSSGPADQKTTFDGRQVKDGLATVEQVGASPVLKSFQALAGQIGGSAAATAVSGTDPIWPPSRTSRGSFGPKRRPRWFRSFGVRCSARR